MKTSANIKFMDRNFTSMLKGIAILCVVLGHLGNANSVRWFAPLGGMGVAIFLVCSGYGLNESYKADVTSKSKLGGGYWKKRFFTVFLPYISVRTIYAVIHYSDFDLLGYILDITCLKPTYSLGWYLRYLLYWYVVWWVIRQTRCQEKKKYIVLAVYSFFGFIFAPSELEAEQSISFLTGVWLSDNKAKTEEWLSERTGRRLKLIVALFVIGFAAFVLKRFLPNANFLIWFSQMLYKYAWALVIILTAWIWIDRKNIRDEQLLYPDGAQSQFNQKKSQVTWLQRVMVDVGAYSYDLYLVHGYFFSRATSVVGFVYFVIVTAILSLPLHSLMQRINKGFAYVGKKN